MNIRKMAERAARTVSDVAGRAEDALRSLQADDEPVGQTPAPVHRKVLSIIYNPVVPSEGGRKLREVLQWNDPDELTRGYIADLQDISYGYANYEVVERLEVDRFPIKQDGFAYTADDFVRVARTNTGAHQPDAVDYTRIVNDFKILDRIASAQVDEVWLFAFPYAGFYESIMGGPGAFWCNAPEMKDTERAGRRFVIMGYNYQRGVGEMLENLGHRAESIVKQAYRYKGGADNLWDRFTRYDQTHPGQAEVGWMHFAPNSVRDYDWGNKSVVKSRHHTWMNFPNLEGEPQDVDTRAWGSGDIREHHRWWFRHLPHITGSAGGISYNWWKYIIDPETVA